ncbi:ABC transporter substrate-binding protein [Tsukamurella strandjordii]|uniref:ABC transporter substrate-binding protein n=1 Tax=Tsukamurella strandjordii TaxID=147577 RepID=A0AA90N7K6_9ACTN|nr:ABC transporter substrate-binding protein [Tsukamurella strandjordii]MDP0397067.1 ABC transporter substrate-binding protein [Tsukamurella strandjordii]
MPVIAGALALVVTLGATSCASQLDETDRALVEAGCAPVANAPKVTGKVTYWSMWTSGEPQMQVLDRAFRCFTEATGVEVDVQWIGRKVLTTSVAPALNTASVPDLIDQDISQVNAAIASSGGVQSVSDVLGMDTGEGKTVEAVLQRTSWDYPQNKLPSGGIKLIPYEMIGNGWWMAPDRVPGFVAPKTTEDLFTLFREARERGVAPVAQDGDIDFYNAYFYSQWAEKYVGPGGFLAAARDRTGGVWRSDPSFLAAARHVERMARDKVFIRGWDASKFPNVQNQWADGQAAYLFVGSWITSEAGQYRIKSGADPLVLRSFQIPKPDDAKFDTVEQLPIGFGITAKARNAAAAKALIAYILHKQNLEPIATKALNLTPRSDIAAPPGLEDIAANFADPSKVKVVAMDAVDGEEPDWATEVFYPLNKQLMLGQLGAEAFVEAMATNTQRYWARKN